MGIGIIKTAPETETERTSPGRGTETGRTAPRTGTEIGRVDPGKETERIAPGTRAETGRIGSGKNAPEAGTEAEELLQEDAAGAGLRRHAQWGRRLTGPGHRRSYTS